MTGTSMPLGLSTFPINEDEPTIVPLQAPTTPTTPSSHRSRRPLMNRISVRQKSNSATSSSSSSSSLKEDSLRDAHEADGNGQHSGSSSCNNNNNTANDSVASSGEVFSMIDRIKQRNAQTSTLHAMIQKAAQKTIIVVRTKNSTQAGESVSIRFHTHQMTELPRSVQLRYICEKVLEAVRFPSLQKRLQFKEIFENEPEVDRLIKDLFWLLTSSSFQPNRQPSLEKSFFCRIADNFTTLFIRLQTQQPSRDCGFFDHLPEVLALIVFSSMYEAFPRTRKSIDEELRKRLVVLVHSWMLGYVPNDLKMTKWEGGLDQESPKKIAALAEFPAMRNRLIRAERIERVRLHIKSRATHADTSEGGSGEGQDSGKHAGDGDSHSSKVRRVRDSDRPHRNEDKSSALQSLTLPTIGDTTTATRSNATEKDATANANANGACSGQMVQGLLRTHERVLQQMTNSPLVETFLRRHHLETNTHDLHFQLRMTTTQQSVFASDPDQDTNTTTTIAPALKTSIASPPKAGAAALATLTSSLSPSAMQKPSIALRSHRHRGRRMAALDAKTFAHTMKQIEAFGDAVRLAHHLEKEHSQVAIRQEKRELRRAHKQLDEEFAGLLANTTKMHEFSNFLVSKKTIQTAPLSNSNNANGNPSSTTKNLVLGAGGATAATVLPGGSVPMTPNSGASGTTFAAPGRRSSATPVSTTASGGV